MLAAGPGFVKHYHVSHVFTAFPVVASSRVWRLSFAAMCMMMMLQFKLISLSCVSVPVKVQQDSLLTVLFLSNTQCLLVSSSWPQAQHHTSSKQNTRRATPESNRPQIRCSRQRAERFHAVEVVQPPPRCPMEEELHHLLHPIEHDQ